MKVLFFVISLFFYSHLSFTQSNINDSPEIFFINKIFLDNAKLDSVLSEYISLTREIKRIYLFSLGKYDNEGMEFSIGYVHDIKDLLKMQPIAYFKFKSETFLVYSSLSLLGTNEINYGNLDLDSLLSNEDSTTYYIGKELSPWKVSLTKDSICIIPEQFPGYDKIQIMRKTINEPPK